MTSITNPKSRKRMTNRQKQDTEVSRTVITSLMREGAGRRYVYLQLYYSGIWHENGDLDPQRMAWKAGLRNEGLRLQSLIFEYCPAQYTLMWQENNQIKKEEAEATAKEQAPAEILEEEEDG